MSSRAAHKPRRRGAPQPLTFGQTPTGIRFGVWGPKRRRPAPTLIVAAADIRTTLRRADFNKIGHLLARHGFVSVAVEAPSHGADIRPGEPADGLGGWRMRLEAGEDFVAGFTRQVIAVLDHLVRERIADPRRMAVAGTSRGGFLGLHLMAVDRRVRCGVAFAPVAVLTMVEEFRGLEKHALTRSLDLANLAGKLAGRPIWMCIGNNDERVGVDSVVAFARAVVRAQHAPGKIAPLQIHLMPTVNHAIHRTAHQEAAAWVAAQLA